MALEGYATAEDKAYAFEAAAIVANGELRSGVWPEEFWLQDDRVPDGDLYWDLKGKFRLSGRTARRVGLAFFSVHVLNPDTGEVLAECSGELHLETPAPLGPRSRLSPLAG